jgi:hypothetical protein
VIVDDVRCFDHLCNPKTFLQSVENSGDFKSVSVSDKWVKYFPKSCNTDCLSELLKIAEFFFYIPSHNATIERIFSLMSAQWTDE